MPFPIIGGTAVYQAGDDRGSRRAACLIKRRDPPFGSSAGDPNGPAGRSALYQIEPKPRRPDRKRRLPRYNHDWPTGMKIDVRLKIAVVGTGISGLSAAWLLSSRHDVTLYERADRVGGHSNTISASVGGRNVPVDTGFIVFNRRTYPNMVALLAHLQVPTEVSEMSFAVSQEAGSIEYSGSGLTGLFGQPVNLLRPRFWSMLADLVRFYRQAPRDLDLMEIEQLSLGDYLERGRYGEAFCRPPHPADGERHLVGAAGRDSRLPGGIFHSLLPQSWSAAAARPARLGDHRRWQPPLCGATGWFLCRTDQARYCGRQRAAHRPWPRRERIPAGASSVTTMW